ncbi:MAG: hypothetical protein KW788_02060 [Candidatus Doudnabacteria bacterium]|nr:hypothetical protein [Candidatus Doudnabacteria bacterium]
MLTLTVKIVGVFLLVVLVVLTVIHPFRFRKEVAALKDLVDLKIREMNRLRLQSGGTSFHMPAGGVTDDAEGEIKSYCREKGYEITFNREQKKISLVKIPQWNRQR